MKLVLLIAVLTGSLFLGGCQTYHHHRGHGHGYHQGHGSHGWKKKQNKRKKNAAQVRRRGWNQYGY